MRNILNKKDNGYIFVVSAPSGAGKTTLIKALLERFKEIIFSVSYTTRKPRPGEKEGIDYHFIDQDEFKKRISAGRWAEWAKVHDHYYGTDARFLDKCIASGRHVVLDIDVQGAARMSKRYPDIVTIFIMPPSLETLKARLNKRGTDSIEVIEKRMTDAEKEIEEKDFYRHIVVNDHLPSAISDFIAIIEKYIAQ